MVFLSIPWDGYTQMMATLVTSGIAIYCLRLFGFFKGGLFHRPFALLTVSFLLYASGSFIDIFAHFYEELEWMHSIHFFTYAIFFALVVTSFHLLYDAWKRMGMHIV